MGLEELKAIHTKGAATAINKNKTALLGFGARGFLWFMSFMVCLVVFLVVVCRLVFLRIGFLGSVFLFFGRMVFEVFLWRGKRLLVFFSKKDKAAALTRGRRGGVVCRVSGCVFGRVFGRAWVDCDVLVLWVFPAMKLMVLFADVFADLFFEGGATLLSDDWVLFVLWLWTLGPWALEG